jgi:MYXO-CTERM domain-containing protein
MLAVDSDFLDSRNQVPIVRLAQEHGLLPTDPLADLHAPSVLPELESDPRVGESVLIQSHAKGSDAPVTGWQWELVSAPEDSEFTLDAASMLDADLVFTPDVPGLWQFKVYVVDEEHRLSEANLEFEVYGSGCEGCSVATDEGRSGALFLSGLFLLVLGRRRRQRLGGVDLGARTGR